MHVAFLLAADWKNRAALRGSRKAERSAECMHTGESDAPKRPHTRHGHCAALYKGCMYVLGGETDAQTRMKDCNKCSRHWAHIVWKLSLNRWQWHRIEPQVRRGYLSSVR